MVLRFPGAEAHQRRLPLGERAAGARRAAARRATTSHGYRRLFDVVEAIEDPHRRYWAGVGLIEAGLAAGASTTAARSAALLVTLADVRSGAARARAQRAEAAEPRRRGAARAVEPDAAEALLEAADAPGPAARRRRIATCASSPREGAMAAPPRAGRRCARALPELVAPRARDRHARAARGGPAPEPVHDRARRGGDAPALPGGGGRRGR